MHNVIPILIFCVSTTLTPGPNNLMIMSSGLNFGVKKSLGHYFGISLGFPAMVLIVALGFGALFTKYQIIHQILKVLSVAYMLYLAWKIANSHNKIDSKKPTKPLSFLQAALFQWINPKAWTMVIGVIAIFTVAHDSVIQQAIKITVLYLLVCLPCTAVWLLFGTVLQRFLKNSTHRRIFNYAMAACLVLSTLLVLLE
ncbi:MAG: LysE family translocator [Coxiellaceae bacterium]|nr:LysE family translocator [Coxiellaceae bacterium]